MLKHTGSGTTVTLWKLIYVIPLN